MLLMSIQSNGEALKVMGGIKPLALQLSQLGARIVNVQREEPEPDLHGRGTGVKLSSGKGNRFGAHYFRRTLKDRRRRELKRHIRILLREMNHQNRFSTRPLKGVVLLRLVSLVVSFYVLVVVSSDRSSHQDLEVQP